MCIARKFIDHFEGQDLDNSRSKFESFEGFKSIEFWGKNDSWWCVTFVDTSKVTFGPPCGATVIETEETRQIERLAFAKALIGMYG